MVMGRNYQCSACGEYHPDEHHEEDCGWRVLVQPGEGLVTITEESSTVYCPSPPCRAQWHQHAFELLIADGISPRQASEMVARNARARSERR